MPDPRESFKRVIYMIGTTWFKTVLDYKRINRIMEVQKGNNFM